MHNILVFGCRKRSSEIRKSFSSQPSKILFAASLQEFKSAASSRVFDLWVIDCNASGADEPSIMDLVTDENSPYVFAVGPESERWITAGQINPRFMLISKNEPVDTWVQSFYELEINQQAENKVKYLAGYINPNPGIETIVTHSPLMRQLTDLVKDVAPTESALLIYGETGTGKELFASILHNESRRKKGPFMAVNCGALPDTLLESELFGYEQGAFTGATGRRIGKIEHATGGTLFLDEIEAMSEAMQIRLLRVLQEKSLQRLGSNIEISTDFRLIAATNAAPDSLLNSDTFRSDLYYRIAVFPIHLPPLRERTEDIPLLATHFVNRKKQDGRTYVQGVDSRALKMLLNCSWPGNIRELQNVIERAVMLADQKMITAELIDIHPFSNKRDGSPGMVEGSAFRPGTTLKSYKTNQADRAERAYLVQLLKHTSGRLNEAAQLAGLTTRALYNKMRSHGLRKEDFKVV